MQPAALEELPAAPCAAQSFGFRWILPEEDSGSRGWESRLRSDACRLDSARFREVFTGEKRDGGLPYNNAGNRKRPRLEDVARALRVVVARRKRELVEKDVYGAHEKLRDEQEQDEGKEEEEDEEEEGASNIFKTRRNCDTIPREASPPRGRRPKTVP